MVSKRIKNDVRIKYVHELRKLGEAPLYRKIVGRGIRQSVEITHPENDCLNYAEAFAALYRKDDKEEYAILARIFRRAAHCILRELNRQNKDRISTQSRFLTLCS